MVFRNETNLVSERSSDFIQGIDGWVAFNALDRCEERRLDRIEMLQRWRLAPKILQHDIHPTIDPDTMVPVLRHAM